MLLLGLYQLGTRTYAARFSASVGLKWQQLSTCRLTQDGTVEKGEVEDNSREDRTECGCVSESLIVSGSRAEIDVQSQDDRQQYRLISSGSTEHKTGQSQIFLPADSLSFPGWTRYSARLDPGWVGKEARLQILPRGSGCGVSWRSVRQRLVFSSEPNAIERTFSLFATNGIQYSVTIALAAVLALWAVLFFAKERALCTVGAVYFLIACAVHFRADAFFYFDEWHVIMRFRELGSAAFFASHNEHFLPLFFFLFYLETILFADRYALYLILSLAVHTSNALLLSSLLSRLGGSSAQARTIARILSLFYLVSSLHAEVLHWAFIVAVLFCQTATLICLNSAWDFVADGKPRQAVIAFWAVFLAPLLFGNGFVLPGQMAGLALLAVFFAQPGQTTLETRLKRLSQLILGSAVFVGACALLYWTYRRGIGHSLEQVQPFDNLNAVMRYMLVGTGLGTILRGAGLYCSLAPDAAREIGVSFIPHYISPLMAFSLLGLGLSIALALPIIRSTEKRKGFSLWLFGLFWIVISFVLPALARWTSGELQALSLRYHSLAVAGLFILALPAAKLAIEGLLKGSVLKRLPLRGKQLGFAAGRKHPAIFVSGLLFFLLWAHLASQLRLGLTYAIFAEFGAKHRNYVAQLAAWQGAKREDIRTEMEPLLPKSITPGSSPQQIYQTLNWLSPSRYPYSLGE